MNVDAATSQRPAVKASSMVTVENLTKVYHTSRGDVTALGDVSLDIQSGEVLVLLGPSGCGKTTLLRCIAGLEFPTTGDITVHGRTVFSSTQNISLPPEKRNLSMVFQSYALWPHMTVFQNIAYPLKVSKVDNASIQQRVAQVLGVAGLEKFAANYPGQLSGGQQQRVALARALVANDGLILFDEPLSNLDAKVRERLRDELITMQQRFGFTAIYVTHDQMEAAVLATRVAVMEVGRVGQLDTPARIFKEPNSRYVADFVGCTNEVPGAVVDEAAGLVIVDTPLGRLSGLSPDQGLRKGQPVMVMFRPENGLVAADPSAPNSFRAHVERCVFLGSHVEYRVKAVGQDFSIRCMDTVVLPNGSDITVSVDPQVLRIFAAETRH